jgi:hypothetical protein
MAIENLDCHYGRRGGRTHAPGHRTAPAPGNRLGRTARVPRNRAAQQAGGRRVERVLLVLGGLLGERDISRLLTRLNTL